jgi:microcystin-dependent protein
MANMPTYQPAGASSAEVAAAIATTTSPTAGLNPGIAPLARQYGIVTAFTPGTPPTLIITLAGSLAPISGIRFMVGYSPQAGDKVIVDSVGGDLIVSGALSGGSGSSGGPVPVGAIMAFPVSIFDASWLLCDGSTFVAANYPLLNTLLGGNTLPNLQGVAPMGAGANGVSLGTRDANGHVLSHNHTSATHSHSHSHSTNWDTAAGASLDGIPPGNLVGAGNTNTVVNTDATSTTPGPTGSTGSGSANVPPNLGVAWYIRAL